MLEVFPNDNIKVDKTLDEKFDFLIDACPEYIGGGGEVMELLEKVMNELPENASKSKRIKLFKEKVKELFHIEKSYPKWWQEPEWPMSNGKPMRFISQKKKQDGWSVYIFEDVDTKEQKTVEQFT